MNKNPITFKMYEHFISRTTNHIESVRSYAKKIDKDAKSQFNLNCKAHDASKFEEFEMVPYIYISWNYHLKAMNREPLEVSPELEQLMKEATNHHILNNKHHPEFWAQNVKIDPNNRDKAIGAIEVFNMDDLSIMEMVCDWTAVSIERNSSSAMDWYKSNVPNRWIFSKEQCELIEKLINEMLLCI